MMHLLIALFLPVAASAQGADSDELPGTIILYGNNGVARIDINGLTIVVPPSGEPVQQAAAAPGSSVPQTESSLLPGVTVITPAQPVAPPPPVAAQPDPAEQRPVEQQVPEEAPLAPQETAVAPDEEEQQAAELPCCCTPCPQ